MRTEWRDFIASHFLAHRFKHGGVSNIEPRHLRIYDLLRVNIKFGALNLICEGHGLVHIVLELGITPLWNVITIGFAIFVATQKYRKEIIWIAIVSGPTQQSHLMFASLQTLAIFTPLI